MNRLAPSATVLVAILGLTACAGPQNNNSADGNLVNGGTFTMAVTQDLGSLNPYVSTAALTKLFGTFLYDTLVSYNEDNEPQPLLAEEWEVIDTTTATFTLRAGITCSDGTALTPVDVAAAINYTADPANQTSILGTLVQPGTHAAVDGHGTITVTSSQPDPFLLQNIGAIPIVCPAGLDDPTLLDQGKAGTGLFAATDIVSGDHYTAERRTDYTWGPGDWDSDQPGIPDTVVARVVTTDSTAANMLMAGQLNMAPVYGPDRERLSAQELFEVESSTPALQLYFNQSPESATADLAVRKAIVQALDLPQLGNVYTAGLGTPADQILSSSSSNPPVCAADTVSGNLPAHSAADASRTLDEAGWLSGPDGIRSKDGAKLTLALPYIATPGDGAALAELMQQQLEAVGVEIILRSGDQMAFHNALQTNSWDLATIPYSWFLPTQMVPWFSGPSFTEGGTNIGAIHNSKYEALVNDAMAIPGTDGCDIWSAAEVALIENLDFIPVYKVSQPIFGMNATFSLAQLPWSIRMTE